MDLTWIIHWRGTIKRQASGSQTVGLYVPEFHPFKEFKSFQPPPVSSPATRLCRNCDGVGSKKQIDHCWWRDLAHRLEVSSCMLPRCDLCRVLADYLSQCSHR